MMEEEFWEYSKKIYAQSHESLLWLQDKRALDVNLLLFCYWLGKNGKRLSMEEINRCCENVKLLRQQFIVPLRSSRRFLKNMDLPTDYEKLKKAILDVELEGERIEQRILVASLPDILVGDEVAEGEYILIMHYNISKYLKHEKVSFDKAIKSTLNKIALSLFPNLSQKVFNQSFCETV